MGENGGERLVRVAAGPTTLEGNLNLPEGARGIVLFAHGSGSSRHSPRNRHVAQLLNQASFATLLVDLLTADEEAIDLRTAQLRFDIGFLAERLAGVTDWLARHPDTRALRIGYFGASTGAAAALVAVAERPAAIDAVVSRGGRARSGRVVPSAGAGANVIDRRRQRFPGHRAEPGGIRTAALREAARDCPRGDASL
jgi:putative phosphoribosyl transferase